MTILVFVASAAPRAEGTVVVQATHTTNMTAVVQAAHTTNVELSKFS